MWRLFCHWLFLTSSSCDSGRLCFVIVTCPGYLYLYFRIFFFFIIWINDLKIYKHFREWTIFLQWRKKKNAINFICFVSFCDRVHQIYWGSSMFVQNFMPQLSEFHVKTYISTDKFHFKSESIFYFFFFFFFFFFLIFTESFLWWSNYTGLHLLALHFVTSHTFYNINIFTNISAFKGNLIWEKYCEI